MTLISADKKSVHIRAIRVIRVLYNKLEDKN